MRKRLLGFLCVTCCILSCSGQDQRAAQQPLAEISYRPGGKLIYLPVQVDGSGLLSFILDTGAPSSMIDTAVAGKLGIRALSEGVIHGAGRGAVTAEDTGNVSLTVGRLTTQIPHAKIVDLSKVPLPIRADGLLGAEFLEKYVVRIDPMKHTIAFYDPKTFVYQGNGTSVPLELTNSRLYVQVGLAARPGRLVERRLRVDTGSEDSIDDDTVRSSPKLQVTTLGNGLGTSYQDVSGIYNKVVLGPYTFQHVWGPAGAVPIIGMEMMRRFTLTFVAQKGMLYLEPNASLNEPIPPPS